MPFVVGEGLQMTGLLHGRRKKSKHQLLAFAPSIYPSPQYNIQKITDNFNTKSFQIKILFLPVAHPELNPIEMVWGFIERTVAAQNMTFKLYAVEHITKEQIKKVTANKFHKYYTHAIKG